MRLAVLSLENSNNIYLRKQGTFNSYLKDPSGSAFFSGVALGAPPGQHTHTQYIYMYIYIYIHI